MPVSEVHHVAMTVSDLERSATFYEQGLGYRRTLRAEVKGADIERSLELPPGTVGQVQYLQGPSQIGQLELIEWSTGEGRPPAKDHAIYGPFLLSFQVPKPELREVLDRLVALGGTPLSEPIRSELQNYGPIDAVALRDPDGVLLELVALPTREEIVAFRAADGAAGAERA
jgi:lactoylglutathione lyase